MYKEILVILSLVGLSFSSSAATDIWCQGSAKNMYVGSDSSLYFLPPWGNWKKLCKLSQNSSGSYYNDISPETCKAWLSMVEISIATGKDLITKHNTDLTCETLPNNGAFPKPIHIKLVQ